jgi:hypothetical protein
MPRSYTANGGIILPANGEESGTWGTLVNENMDILDRLTNGIGTLTLTGTTHTLTTADGALSDGQFRVIVLGGSPSGTNTITVAPNDGEHIYFVKNLSGQSAIFTQGSGGNVTIPNGDTKFIYCDGNGSGAAVQDITSDLNVAGTVVAEGLTVNTFTDNAVIGQFILWDATGGAQPYVRLAHSLGASVGSHTAVTADDGLGVLTFAGSTGSAFYDGAAITARSTQSFTGSNGGTKLEFQTTEDSTQTLATKMTIDNDGKVGIGVSAPSELLEVGGSTSNNYIQVSAADNSASGIKFRSDSSNTTGWDVGYEGDGNYLFFRNDVGGTVTERMRIDSSGNVGIGTSSPTNPLTVIGSATIGTTTVAPITTELHVHKDAAGGLVPFGDESTVVISTNSTDAGSQGYIGSLWFGSQDISAANQYGWKMAGMAGYMSGDTTTTGGSADLLFYTADESQTGTERMRITSSGDLLVAKTSPDVAIVGAELRADGVITGTVDGGAVAFFNRTTSDGAIVSFRKDNTTAGVIGCHTLGGAAEIFIGNANLIGLAFEQTGADRVFPCDGTTGAERDNAIDFGAATARFDDIWATNGTIQTSDRNEKQDIEALSEAEQRVAVACKGLLRKFRWKSSVEEKGDDARIHFGIIAQDLQAAFEAEGLDAGRYAMFIYSTWVDKETGEERSRMGVRYPQLLAFIIAAI